jgi:hypothetical protein
MTDDRYWRNRHRAGVKIKKVPSEYFRDNWLATFIVDRNGISVRHQVGIDNMSWSTDFPPPRQRLAVLAEDDRRALRRRPRRGAREDRLHQTPLASGA